MIIYNNQILKVIVAMKIMLMVFVTTGCGTVTTRSSQSESSNLQPYEFEFKDGGKSIYYTFVLGQKRVNDTAIFFISGSGCASVKDRFPGYFNPLLDVNASVYIMQKRGISDGDSGALCSSKFVNNDNYNTILSDQMEFITSKIESNKSRYKNIVLIGASEGALVAAKIAQINSNITHLGLIGSGGSSLRNYMKLLGRKRLFFFNVDSNLSSIAKYPYSLKDKVWGHTYRYWSSILDVDLREILPELEINIVIAMGEEDKYVPVETLDPLQEKFKKLGKNNLIVLRYSGADHKLYSQGKSKSYAPNFLNTIKALLKQKT